MPEGRVHSQIDELRCVLFCDPGRRGRDLLWRLFFVQDFQRRLDSLFAAIRVKERGVEFAVEHSLGSAFWSW